MKTEVVKKNFTVADGVTAILKLKDVNMLLLMYLLIMIWRLIFIENRVTIQEC